MPFGVDFPNISTGNPFTSVDTFDSTKANNNALNPIGSVWQMPVQPDGSYAGFTFAPTVQVVATTNTSTSLTSVNPTGELFVGMTITGTGIPAATTITAISGSTVTISAAATASATIVATGTLNVKNQFNGYPPILKYVRYLSTTNTALNAAPSAVYYADSTGTVVTGVAVESYGLASATAAALDSAAGILLPNTTAGPTATILNGNFCWIQVGGLCPGVVVPSAGAGIYSTLSVATTGAFTMTAVATGTAPTIPLFVGTQWSVRTSGGLADVLVNPLLAIA